VHNIHHNKTVPETFRSEMIVSDSLVHEVDVCRWLFDDEIATITVLAPKPTGGAAEGLLDPQAGVRGRPVRRCVGTAAVMGHGEA
jgi:myo-inositol 2-dehydrogenase/D-chiro-inositol 1-dehydrogenase